MIPLTWSAEVSCVAVDGDAAVLTGTTQRHLVPHPVIYTACCGLDLDPARPEVKVKVDVSVEQLEGEEIGLQHESYNMWQRKAR